MSEEGGNGGMPMRCLNEERLADDGFDISEVLNDVYRRANKEPWSRTVGVYHPSGLRMCKRSLYYDRISQPCVPCVSTQLQGLFDLGHAIHEKLQARLATTPHVGAIEDEVTSSCAELYMSGSCDMITWDPDWIIEIKTIGDTSYKTLTKPKIEHIWQVHCYMFMNDIPRAQLLYVNRNTGSRRMFRVMFSNDVWDEILNVIDEIEIAVEEGVEPAREVNSFWCRGCKFKYVCEPDI